MLVGKFKLKGINLGMARAIFDFLEIPLKREPALVDMT